MSRTLSIVFITSFFLCGCDKIPFLNSSQPDSSPKTAPAATTAAPKEEVKIAGALLARVNDWAIGVDDFKSYINTLKPVAQAQGIDVDDAEFKSNLLQDMVRKQVLAQIAVERGLDNKSDIIKALRETKTTLLASQIVSDVEKNVNVTYAEVQKFYDEKKELLRKPEERKISEIVCRSEFDVKDVNIKLLQGESFSALARSSSVSDTKGKGGDMGFVTPDIEQRPLKFWQVAFQQLEKGQTSNYFEADGKYYIIKVEDIKPGEVMPLNSEITMADGSKVKIEDQIQTSLKADKADKEIKRLIDDYKTRSKVEIKEDLLK